MTFDSLRYRARRAAFLAALALPVLFAACDGDDPNDPDEPAENGTWAFVEDGITSIIRITDDEIQIFSNTGTCYIPFELGIVDREGTTFTVDTGGANVHWDVERVGANLVVEDDEGVSRTLTPSTANVSTLVGLHLVRPVPVADRHNDRRQRDHDGCQPGRRGLVPHHHRRRGRRALRRG